MLLRKIEEQGGVKHAPVGLLFELRFAFELTLYCPDARIEYETHAGVANSTVDFRVATGDCEWLIELVSIEESQPVRKMLSDSRVKVCSGAWSETLSFDSTDSDPYLTPRAELIRVSEKIAGKVWDSRSAVRLKFPARGSGIVHVLLVDMNGFEGTGDPDPHHCREIALGSGAIPSEDRSVEWRTGQPVRGLFERGNPQRGAQELQSSVDLIGFVAEDRAHEHDDEIGRNVYLIANPKVMAGNKLVEAFPVRSATALRNPLGMRAGAFASCESDESSE